jgi:HlyD family secretion protein
MRKFRVALAVLALLGAAAAGAWYSLHQQQRRLPDHIALGNGRIEAQEIHIAATFAGRLAEVLVEEGEMVEAGQVLARIDTAEREANLQEARAEIAQAEHAVAEAKAEIGRRESELKFAQQELNRALQLFEKGHLAQQRVDQRMTERDTARAALQVAQARLTTSERAVDAKTAAAKQIQTQIDDSFLKAPRAGRIQYRLAEPGEVLAAGERVVTFLDLSDVYMTIFLPTAQVGRVFIGSEARIVLDAAPEYVIPAKVSFVAAEAQFTPRQVETASEREKLMFRVKVKIDPALLLAHAEKVKTGLPGEAYVRLGADGQWPERLAVKLPPVRTEQ